MREVREDLVGPGGMDWALAGIGKNRENWSQVSPESVADSDSDS